MPIDAAPYAKPSKTVCILAYLQRISKPRITAGLRGGVLSTPAPDQRNTIRAQLNVANWPILILCSSNALHDRADYFRAGAADVVEATCDLREILSRLRSAMRRATAAREVALRSGTTRA